METINAKRIRNESLSTISRQGAGRSIMMHGCCGERYIGCGMRGNEITIIGTPGNALGAFMNGGSITVRGNGQDAVGDTMNDGTIYIDGSVGDAAGYAMRGGKIFVHGDAGYRAGVNMKAYGEKSPALVIGGSAGSFLGEYLAGGTIVVLGLGKKRNSPLTGFFCGNGMYNGKIFLRTTEIPIGLSKHLIKRSATDEEKKNELTPLIEEFASVFDEDSSTILHGDFMVIEPDPDNRYRELYAQL